MRRLPHPHQPDLDENARTSEELAIAKELLRRVGERSLNLPCPGTTGPAKRTRRKLSKTGPRH